MEERSTTILEASAGRRALLDRRSYRDVDYVSAMRTNTALALHRVQQAKVLHQITASNHTHELMLFLERCLNFYFYRG